MLKGLKLLRLIGFLTQAELARLVGCSIATVSNWETGKAIPSAINIQKLAEVFNEPPEKILNCILETKKDQD